MAYRYCHACNNGLDRITLEEIQVALIGGSWTEHVQCDHCKSDRQDDTPNERFSVLLDAFLELKATVNGDTKT